MAIPSQSSARLALTPSPEVSQGPSPAACCQLSAHLRFQVTFLFYLFGFYLSIHPSSTYRLSSICPPIRPSPVFCLSVHLPPHHSQSQYGSHTGPTGCPPVSFSDNMAHCTCVAVCPSSQLPFAVSWVSRISAQTAPGASASCLCLLPSRAASAPP